jgi:transcriptional regulator GlxA family with amidase domain
MDYRIEEILVKIENGISQTMTVRDLADSVNLSISHFQHLFKQEVSISLTQYVKELRLQKAREFLETTHLRVKEIRLRVGVTDTNHFWRDFKRKFGKTPNQLRRNYRNSRNSQ